MPHSKSKFPFDHKQVFGELALAVAINPNLLKQIEFTFIPDKRESFTAVLQGLLLEEHHAQIKDVFSAFLTYCRQVKLNFYHTFYY